MAFGDIKHIFAKDTGSSYVCQPEDCFLIIHMQQVAMQPFHLTLPPVGTSNSHHIVVIDGDGDFMNTKGSLFIKCAPGDNCDAEPGGDGTLLDNDGECLWLIENTPRKQWKVLSQYSFV